MRQSLIIPRLDLADYIMHNSTGGLFVDFTAAGPFGSKAADAGALVDYLGMIFMHSQMPTDMRTAIVDYVSMVPGERCDGPGQLGRLSGGHFVAIQDHALSCEPNIGANDENQPAKFSELCRDSCRESALGLRPFGAMNALLSPRKSEDSGAASLAANRRVASWKSLNGPMTCHFRSVVTLLDRSIRFPRQAPEDVLMRSAQSPLANKNALTPLPRAQTLVPCG
jgi:hypothetical protein